MWLDKLVACQIPHYVLIPLSLMRHGQTTQFNVDEVFNFLVHVSFGIIVEGFAICKKNDGPYFVKGCECSTA